MTSQVADAGRRTDAMTITWRVVMTTANAKRIVIADGLAHEKAYQIRRLIGLRGKTVDVELDVSNG